MTRVDVFLAQRTVSDEPTPALQILGERELPDLPYPTTDAERDAALATRMATFKSQASAIADALFATLPGGTLDQLLVEMLQRKASHFVVRF